MKATRLLQLLPVAASALLLTSCIDSKVPLSDPHNSKPDDRLIGVWRFRGESGETNYYHVGRVGEKLPASVMWVTGIQHKQGGTMEQTELLIFPTTLGGKTYLNATEAGVERRKMLEEKSWTPEAVDAYLILRYQITDDLLAIQWMDGDAKQRAVNAGKIKGVIAKDQDGNTRAHFNDTTENLSKFVMEAGDDLFSKDVLRLERVK